MIIAKHRKIFFALSGILSIISVFLLVTHTPHLGIDFSGGTLIEVTSPNGISLDAAKASVKGTPAEDASIRASGDNGISIRSKVLTEADKQTILNNLQSKFAEPITLSRATTIGPSISSSLTRKAVYGVSWAIIAIVLFIAFAFRKVSKPVSSWKYGLAAIIALFHDVLISVGFYTLLSITRGAEIDILFVSAVLAVLGYSVHDTIVVFDRIRERLRTNEEKHNKEPFVETVGKSIRETAGRSINTSLTIFFTLLALVIWGPAITANFALVLLFGVIIGTYSSVCLASPLLIAFEGKSEKKK
jgi:preprotein translocase subunit SecF